MNSIHAFGVEELFFDGKKKEDKYRLQLSRDIGKTHVVMVSDHVNKEKEEDEATQRNTKEGFLSFIRSSKNYDYKFIPPKIIIDGKDINTLKDAKNYLYLINPENFKSKLAMVQSISSTNYDVIIIDAFYNNEPLTRDDVARLQVKANGGKRLVICYLNVGAAESFRYYWEKDWKLHSPHFLKKAYEGYHDEMWVKYWSPEWKDVILYGPRSYFSFVLAAGFDGVYLDNVEAYYSIYFD